MTVQEMRVKAPSGGFGRRVHTDSHAKACGKMYHAPVFANGDTRKQLLARSIYLLYKKNLYGLSLKGYGRDSI